MRLTQIYLALIPGATAAALNNVVQRCITPDLAANVIAQHDAAYEEYRNSSTFQSLAQADLVIPTYIHVVTTYAKRFKYSETMISQQIDYLNRKYSRMGISFQVLGTDFRTNDEWARMSYGSAAESNMRINLQQNYGQYDTLNLYFVSDLSAESGEPPLGFCRFPVQNPQPHNFLFDGCINSAETLPGGGSPQYNLGATAVHEVGHWLDLYHPFQGENCDGPGDHVSDTPAQKYPSFGCDFGKNTCPSHPGDDNIHNIMDYSDDSCLFSFSEGQSQRARISFDRLRAGVRLS